MTESTRQPKPKRRWLRFSLRTFLIVLTISCVWIGWYVYRAEKQRGAVEWIEENGGHVFYDYEFDSHEWLVAESQPPVPKWLLNSLNINYFASVARVDIIDGKSQISDLTPLAELKNLEGLNLLFIQVTDLQPLAGLKNLKLLNLQFTPVSDLQPLAGLKNLESLDLLLTQVTDLQPLAGLKNLESLNLYGNQISDLQPLAGLTNLKDLLLGDTQVSDEEIEKLKLALPNCHIEH